MTRLAIPRVNQRDFTVRESAYCCATSISHLKVRQHLHHF